jgi:hypothetical protein
MRTARVLMIVRIETSHRLPEGLRRNGTRLDANAADVRLFFHDGHAFAQLRRLNCGPLTRGTAADTNEVELVHGRELKDSGRDMGLRTRLKTATPGPE